MFRPAFVVLLLAITVRAQNCDDKNHAINFMRCISFQANGFPRSPQPERYAALESEYYNSIVNRALTCERNSRCDAGLSTYQKGDFLKPGGTLQQDCKICYKIVKEIMQVVTEAPADVKSCIRRSIAAEVSHEMKSCISRKVGFPFFTLTKDDFPDFDIQGDTIENRDDVTETLTYAINAFYKFNQCPNKDAALDCFDASSVLPGHCEITGFCVDRIQKAHQCSIRGIEGATCECFNEGGDKAKKFSEKVLRVLDAAATDSTATCVAKITDALTSPETGRNLMDMASEMIGGCTGKRKNLGQYLGLGCKLARRQKGKEMLVTVINLVNAAIDALSLRVSRFCESDCN